MDVNEFTLMGETVFEVVFTFPDDSVLGKTSTDDFEDWADEAGFETDFYFAGLGGAQGQVFLYVKAMDAVEPFVTAVAEKFSTEIA